MGTLMVYTYSGSSKKMVFSTTGDQKDVWKVASVSIKSQYGFRIHIVGTKGSNYTGDIAIDDISFYGNCKFTTDSALMYGANALTTGRQWVKCTVYTPRESSILRGDLAWCLLNQRLET